MLHIEALDVLPIRAAHLDIAPGITALTAPSGAGKSRFFRAIADLVVNVGEVRLADTKRAEVSAPEWRHLVRYVSSEPAWWAPTARANLPDNPNVISLAKQFDLAPTLFDSPIEQLSSGERQRFGLVRAMADNPPVLLVDEPTAALDNDSRERVEAELLRRAGQGCIIFIISHSDAQIARIANRVLTIEDGKVRER